MNTSNPLWYEKLISSNIWSIIKHNRELIVIPGRKVAHISYFNKYAGFCGLTDTYQQKDINIYTSTDLSVIPRICEQCIISYLGSRRQWRELLLSLKDSSKGETNVS